MFNLFLYKRQTRFRDILFVLRWKGDAFLCVIPLISHTHHILKFQRWSWWHPGVFPTKHCDESPDSPSQESVRPQSPARHSSPGYASPPLHLIFVLWTINTTWQKRWVVCAKQVTGCCEEQPNNTESRSTHIHQSCLPSLLCWWCEALWRVPHPAGPAGHRQAWRVDWIP